MFGYLAIAGLSLLGWALYDSNQPKKGGTTPLQNSLGGSPYQVGQKVRVPLNQMPANVIPAGMLAAFNQTASSSLIVQVTGIQPGVLQGNLLATDGPEGQIMMPTPLPIAFP